MTAQNPNEEKILPKEPLDLPKEPLDLPSGPTQNEARKHTHASVHPHHKTEHPHDIKTILEWTAPGRPFRKRGRQYYLTSLLIMLLVEVILFLFSQYMLMLVVLAFVFVAFALNTVPPHDFKYRISSEGITVEDHFFLWQELYDFYFKKREGVDVVHIRTHAFIPGELTLTLGETDREHLKGALLPYLPYREFVKPTFMDKSADWLTRNFPLEKES
ncbi:MAG: hypothetical protein Q8P26_03520 [Candidatus Levybacteria bacterium]|nr:hypothetical protein [Candidatus Levybacteria bacterium]